MRFLILFSIFLFLGCVSSSSNVVVLTGYSTATWEDSNNNYFVVYFDENGQPASSGICQIDLNTFNAERLFLREQFYSKTPVAFDTQSSSPCGIWNRKLYDREIVSIHGFNPTGGV